VEGSLENAMDLFREVLLEKRADIVSTLRPLDNDLARLPESRSARRRVEHSVRNSELDFLCIVTRRETGRSEVVYSFGLASLLEQLTDSTGYLEGELPTSFVLAESCLVVTRPLPLRAGSSVIAGLSVDRNMLETGSGISSTLERYRQLDFYQIVNKQMVWIVFAALAVLVVFSSSVLARSLASSVSRPVTALEKGMKRVSEGDLDHCVDARGTDEVNFLVDSFNRMTNDLKISKERLRRAERVAAWRDIARRAAHEIKNPLLPMSFAISRLRESLSREAGSADSEVQSALDSVSEQMETLSGLASQFSELGKLPDPTLAPLDITEVVQSVVSLYRTDSCKFELACEEPLPLVMADKNQISRVLVNLVSNAIDAMNGSGVVRIDVSHEREDAGHWVRASVTDTGSGIPEQERDRIFDPYFTTKAKGTGLGLAIISKIVTDHNGNVTVESEEGKGSTFSLWLPARSEPDESDAEEKSSTAQA
jgi:nitrogen fixation/metabolism regulation signal transduction histidine kinase